MPIYEYRCEACGEELEKLQRMSDEPLRDCPACGKPALKRLISAAAFRLKGSGWYETDFKSGNKRNLADSGDSDGGAKAGTDGKADSKSSGKSSGGETGGKAAGSSSKSAGESAGKSGAKASSASDKSA